VSRSLETGEARAVTSVALPSQLGRPALDGDTLVYHVASGRLSRLVTVDLATGASSVVRSTRSAQLTNPSVLGDELLYVRITSAAQQLLLGRLAPGGRNRVLYRLGAPAPHDNGYERGHSHHTRTKRPPLAAGTLWTTALSAAHAYVTFIPRRGGAAGASIVDVPR
jgi:hypothetical protein